MRPGASTGEVRPFQRVLLVEDDRALLELLTDYLELQGVEVVAVESGEAAWRALDGPSPPDLVLLDIRMPGISGDEVIRRMRSSPHLAHIPVAAMTGLQPGELHLVSPPDVLLSKPFDIETLGAALARIGHGAGAPSGPGGTAPLIGG